MKTVKLLMMVVIMALFSAGNVFAQGKKTAWTITGPFTGVAACGSERVIGTVTYEWKWWEGQRYLLKISYSLVGETSGAHYEARAIENNMVIDMPGAGSNGTWITTFHVKRNGVPTGLWHITYHYTVNPDGELSTEVVNVVQKCF